MRFPTDRRRSGYVISQIPSQLICTRGKAAFTTLTMTSWYYGTLTHRTVRPSLWCPSWELFWVIVTFATASVKTTHQLYACRFLVRNHMFSNAYRCSALTRIRLAWQREHSIQQYTPF